MRTPGLAAIKYVALSVFAGVFLLGHQPVQAQSEGGALVLRSCPDTTAFYGQTQGYAYEVCADIVFTPSGNVNATFHGSLIDPSKAPAKPIVAKGFPCEYGGLSATDTHVVITPDGSVNGYCHLHD